MSANGDPEARAVPTGWRVARLAELCDFVRGTEPGRDQYNRDREGVPFVRVGNISAGAQELVYTASANLVACNEQDILMTFDGSPGVVRRGFIGAISSGIRKVVVQNAELDRDFLFYALQAGMVQDAVREYSAGVTIKHASKSIPHLQTLLPPLPEQRAIAALLGRLQHAKETGDAVLGTTRQLRASLMHHLFTYGSVTFREADHVPLKDTDFGQVPQVWEVVQLGSAVVEIDYGFSAPIPSVPPAHGVRIVSTADITKDGKMRYGKIRSVEVPARTAARLTLRGGDILFNWRNSPELVGKSAIFEGQSEPHIFASFILRVRTDEKRTNNVYLKHLLNYFREKGVFLMLARRAVNQANYNRNELSILKIPLPPYIEQRSIASQLEAVDAKLAAEAGRQAALAALFEALLYHLMTGLRRVAPPRPPNA